VAFRLNQCFTRKKAIKMVYVKRGKGLPTMLKRLQGFLFSKELFLVVLAAILDRLL